MPIKKLILFLVLLAAAILFVAYLAMDNRENPGTAVNLPPLEASFIDVVSRAQDDSQKAENDMQKGGIKAKRDTALCNVMTTLQVNDWIGTIEKIDSNSDGKGVLEISIAHGINVETWNNDLSDIGSNTLLDPRSAIFEVASSMKTGQLVRFSGTFLPSSDNDCLNESSLTLDGKLESPEFIFRFLHLSAYDPSEQGVTNLSPPEQATTSPSLLTQSQQPAAASQEVPTPDSIPSTATGESTPIANTPSNISSIDNTPTAPVVVQTGEATASNLSMSTTQTRAGTVNVGTEAAFGPRFAFYVQNITQKVAAQWYPQMLDPQAAGHRVYITFQVERDGSLTHIVLAQPSRDPTLDSTALNAVRHIDTFGPLPDAYSGSHINVTYYFDPPPHSAAPAISANGTIMVQIAVVSSQNVADILLASLQKKGYSVIVRHEPQDKLLHVEIGPFATQQDAEAMQQRLLADGFNAIVK